MCLFRYKGFFHISNKNVETEYVWYYSPQLDKETKTAYSTRTMWTFEAGVRWIRERELMPAPPKCFTFAIRSNPMDSNNESFSMEHLQLFFCTLFFGYFLSLTTLVVEHIKFRCINKKRNIAQIRKTPISIKRGIALNASKVMTRAVPRSASPWLRKPILKNIKGHN